SPRCLCHRRLLGTAVARFRCAGGPRITDRAAPPYQTASVVHLAGWSIVLTCAATMRQPCGNRTHVCIVRPSFPDGRRCKVDAVAKSRPNVVITVRSGLGAAGAVTVDR